MKTAYWAPRILGIIFVLFISLFSLDAGNLIGWIIHMIPSFIILAVLIFAWKMQLPGGILFCTLGVISIFFFHTYRTALSFFLISGPFFYTGILFILDWRVKNVKRGTQKKRTKKH